VSVLLAVSESIQRLWRKHTRRWIMAYIAVVIIGFLAGFVWAKASDAAWHPPLKADIGLKASTGKTTAMTANMNWPVLDVNLAIKRSRVHTYTRCRKMEFTIELAKVILCEAYGVFGKKCRRQSLFDTARVNCPVWWRLYHVREDNDRHCEGKVSSWLYQDRTSPTGWMIDSRMYNVRCYWETQLG